MVSIGTLLVGVVTLIVTILILQGSPAINAIPKGTNGCSTEIKTAQRGVKRPQGSGCDIGTFGKKRRR